MAEPRGEHIGHDVWIRFVKGSRSGPYADQRVGLIENHPKVGGAEGERCEGCVFWLDTDPERERWELVSEEPLHLEPSIQCTECAHHGFIRDGKWEPV